jgi:hypothetical protein
LFLRVLHRLRGERCWCEWVRGPEDERVRVGEPKCGT